MLTPKSSTAPLANMWASLRTLRIADGPDEVHLQQMGRNENKRGAAVTAIINAQMKATEQLFAKYQMKHSQFGDKIQSRL